MSSRWIFALIFAAFGAGCTDVLPSGPGGSGGDFEVGAGPGTQPVYTWSAGPAFSVTVVRTANPSVVVWRLADPNNNDIRSPLRHGDRPEGAFETVSRERTLTRGIEYRVTISLQDGRSGFREFTP